MTCDALCERERAKTRERLPRERERLPHERERLPHAL